MGNKIKKIDLPDKWQIKKLKSIIDPKRSIRYGIVQPGDYDPNGRFMVRGQDYSFGWVNPNQLFKVSDEIELKYKNARLKEGDLILTIVGAGTGNVSVVPNWLDGANCTQTTARIAIDTNLVNSNYCYQYLISDFGKKLTYKNIKGGAQPGLNCGDIEKYEILLPPLPEQRAIANILSTWDTAIQTTQALISQKEQEKNWLMQNLLTGKKRLKGFSGDWKEIHIRDVSKEVSIKNKSDKQLTVLSCTKYKGLVPSLEYFGRKIFADDVSTYKIVPLNHFAYATNHIEEGSIGYQERYNEALISPMYTVFKTDESVNDTFIYRLLKSHPLVYQYQNRMEGSIDRRGGLRWDAFSIIKIKLPTLEEQTVIAQVLQTAEKEIELLKTKLEQQKLQKKGLMQVLLTGKVRVVMA
jgi:type I restriction enzyme S subunit